MQRSPSAKLLRGSNCSQCCQVTHQHRGVSRSSGYHYHRVIWNKTVNVRLTQAFQHIQRNVLLLHCLLSVSRWHKHTKNPYRLLLTHYILSVKSLEDFPRWMESFLSLQEKNARRLDLCFYIIFLQPTHTSHSPTSDKKLSDRMWLTSFGSQSLNSSSVTLLWWPLSSFHCLYLSLLHSVTMDYILWCVLSLWRTHCFTGICMYILSKWGFDYIHMNAIWQQWWCPSHKSAAHELSFKWIIY